MLPEEWRDRYPARVAQDQTSHTHPAAGQIFAALAQATGVNFTNPRLVVVPDDPALGEFRKTFAGEFGTIDEYPLPAAEGRPGFMGATEIISTTDLWERWLAGPENRIDSRALLKARALDLWLDNYDDHRGQWRWMRIPGQDLYQPLAEDPDMVLVHHDGVLMANHRGRIPKQLNVLLHSMHPVHVTRFLWSLILSFSHQLRTPAGKRKFDSLAVHGVPDQQIEEDRIMDSRASLGRTYQDGEVIVRQGETGNCMYVIQDGYVEVVKETNGQEVILAILGESDFFGEMAIFENEVRAANVRAIDSASGSHHRQQEPTASNS